MKQTITLLIVLLFNTAIVHANPPDATVPPEPPGAAKAIEKPTAEAMRALAKSICDGDKKAFDVLCATHDDLYRDPANDINTNCSLVREAFDLLGKECAKGNVFAFDALKAGTKKGVYSFALEGLGIAAAGGHKEALDILINEKDLGNLIEPASANIQPAVEFLIQMLRTHDDMAVQYMASQGLKGAAQKGNAQAKAALDEYARAHPEAEDVPEIPVTLKVGSLAPQLSVGEWVQGDPVKAFEKDKVYLVEFWATWCPPCVASIPDLNDVHLKYRDKGLVVIGQNVGERDPSQVKPFVAKMGNKMTYRVALDDVSKSQSGAMCETWMLAAGQSGIPAAFLVGKDGRIAWIGNPKELKDSMIESALAGK